MPDHTPAQLTLAAVNEAVEHIRFVAHDDETAHSCEDDLRRLFIQHVAGRTDVPDDLAAMARAVLSTEGISFARWCA